MRYRPSPPVLPTSSNDLPSNRRPRRATPNRVSGERATIADPIGEPVRGTDVDLLSRLTAIEHRLHQVSIQLSTLLSQLDQNCATLETLSLRPAWYRGSLGDQDTQRGRAAR